MSLHSVLLLRVSSAVDKNADHPQFFDPPYPLKYLQAGLRNRSDATVHFLDCWIHPMGTPQLLDWISDIRPDTVVISASSFDIDVAAEVTGALKRWASPPLVIGVGQGHYLSDDAPLGAEHLHVAYNAGCDAVILGEPEEEFFRLFDWILRDGVEDPGWREHYRRAFTEEKRFVVNDPDGLPFPSYTPEELKDYKSIFPVRVNKQVVWGYLIATRGCPHGCVFCSEVMRVSTGKKIRSRSAANVADEMEHLARLGVNVCSFQDDSFSANRRFVRELCEELIRRGSTMPWMARVRVDEVDHEVIALMQRAGCILLGLGVESGSVRIIERMHKTNKPELWMERCRSAFGAARRLGVGTHAYYVIGNPTETREEIDQTIRFALELNSDSIQVHYYTPYPGSAAWAQMKEDAPDYDFTKMFHYSTPIFTMADVSVEELVRLRSEFYKRYLFRPLFAVRHLYLYAGFYWRNPDVFQSLAGVRKII